MIALDKWGIVCFSFRCHGKWPAKMLNYTDSISGDRQFHRDIVNFTWAAIHNIFHERFISTKLVKNDLDYTDAAKIEELMLKETFKDHRETWSSIQLEMDKSKCRFDDGKGTADDIYAWINLVQAYLGNIAHNLNQFDFCLYCDEDIKKIFLPKILEEVEYEEVQALIPFKNWVKETVWLAKTDNLTAERLAILVDLYKIAKKIE